MGEFDGLDPHGNVGGSEQPQGNPAWSEFLEAVPQELHEKVTPILQKWDAGVQDRFQKVHSEYEPWKPIIGTGTTPDDVNFALNVLNTLNTNPEYVYNTLKDYLKKEDSPNGNTGSGSGQGQLEPNQDPEFKDPRVDMLEQQYQKMAQILLSEKEAQKAAQEDAQLDAELTGLKKKYGDFDESYVLAKMEYENKSGEEAVQMFIKMRDGLASQGPKPLILGAGSGGVPGANTDIRKVDDATARGFALQMLQRAAHERNQ